jgi:hypothetical protein
VKIRASIKSIGLAPDPILEDRKTMAAEPALISREEAIITAACTVQSWSWRWQVQPSSIFWVSSETCVQTQLTKNFRLCCSKMDKSSTAYVKRVRSRKRPSSYAATQPATWRKRGRRAIAESHDDLLRRLRAAEREDFRLAIV